MRKKLFVFVATVFLLFNVKALTCDEDKHIVKYNLQGGKMALKEECVSVNITSKVPTRKNYAFLGWSDSSNGSVIYQKGSNISLEEDITLYAKWGKQIKISLNANGGKLSSKYKSKKVYNGLTYGSLAKPTRKGYTFKGWYTAKSGGTLIESSSIVTSSKNHTLYARWEKITYTIEYELNGGNNSSKNPSTYTVTSKIKLSNPSKEGYTFSGWYTKSNYKGKISTIKSSTGNKKLYAKWTPIKYNVKYVGNGSTKGSSKTSKNINYNKNYTVLKNWYTKKNYTFVGWNTNKNGTGTSYKAGEVVKNLSKKNKSTITLYAQWKVTEYSIKYELNGGTNNSSNPSTYTIYTNDINLLSPTRENYTFVGWYSDVSLSKSITKIQKGSTGNKTIYAKWEKIPQCTYSKYPNASSIYSRLSDSPDELEIYWFYDNYDLDNCYLTYKASGDSINLIKENGKAYIEAKKIGTGEVSVCINNKHTNKEMECVKNTVIVDGYEHTSNLAARVNSELLNAINGYYWYLDDPADSYAYLYPTVMDWYDHQLLNWDSENIKLDNNKFVLSKDTNEKYNNDDGIHNTFLVNPVEFAYQLIVDYNMHVSNNKLYITLGDKTYSFTKHTSKIENSSEITVTPSSINVNEGEEFELTINYKPAYDYNYFTVSSEWNEWQNYYGGGGFRAAGCMIKDEYTKGKATFTCTAASNIFGRTGFESPFKSNITITDTYGTTKSIPITIKHVPINVTSIKLSQNEKDMLRGDTAKLTYTIEPENAENQKVTWASSDSGIVSVDNEGNIRAVAKGTATITVTTEDGNYHDSCEITVDNPPLTAKASIGVSTIMSSSSISRGISVSITPTGGTGAYVYYLIMLYDGDGQLLDISNNKELFNSNYLNGSYYAEYTVRDSEGHEYSGNTGITTISGF